MAKLITTVTVTEKKDLEVSAIELEDIIRKHYGLDGSAMVDFDISQGSFVDGCTITTKTSSSSEQEEEL